jgi:hypothetical protein
MPDSDAFVLFPVTSTTVSRVFFVGLVVPHSNNQYPAPMDTSSNVPGRTWVTGESTPGQYSGTSVAGALGLFEVSAAGLPCNWLLRAVGGPSISTYCTAKTNSVGCVPAIGSIGSPSPVATGGFVVEASNMINNKSCLLFYSLSGQAATPFQGGYLCVQPAIRRTPVTNSGGTPPPNNCSGVASIDMNCFASGNCGGSPVAGMHDPGNTVYCQWWGRDQGFASPNNTQLSDGLRYTVDSGNFIPPPPPFSDMVFNGTVVQLGSWGSSNHSATLSGTVVVPSDGSTSGTVSVVFDDGWIEDLVFTSPHDFTIQSVSGTSTLDFLTGGVVVYSDQALLNGSPVSLLSLVQQLETEVANGLSPGAMSSGSRALLSLAAIGKTSVWADNACAAKSSATDATGSKFCKLVVNSSLAAVATIISGGCATLCVLGGMVSFGFFAVPCLVFCAGSVFIGYVALRNYFLNHWKP